MRTNWIKARQTRFTAYVAVYIAIVLGVVILANWLADRHNKSIDTTRNQRFSLSEQTEKLVRGLKQDVRVTYWDRSSRFLTAKDLLGRYEALSPKLKVDYVDPVAKPQAARSANVRELGLIRIETNGRSEEARSLTEEELTGGIMRALKGAERSICFVAGAGEGSTGDSGREGYSSLKQLVERETYKTRDITLLAKPEIPSDCTIAAILRPKFDYPEPVIAAIKTYVENGGRLLVLTGAPVQAGKEPAGENTTLLKLLEGWGVIANRNIILEASANAQVLGPEVPLVSDYASHPIVRDLSRAFAAMPLARSLEAKSAGNATAERLFSSSEASLEGTIAGTQVRLDPNTAKKGPFVLGAAATYKTAKQGVQGRVVVVGSADWVSNAFLRFNANPSLIMNTFNWLSSDEDLISIRPKEPESQPLNISAGQMRMVMYTSLILLPLLAIAAGLSVWWQRR